MSRRAVEGAARRPVDGEEVRAMVKLGVTAIVAAFVLFYIITSPGPAANMVHDVWHMAVGAAHGIGDFFDQVSSSSSS